jgi:CheY-like chemotaxis protein
VHWSKKGLETVGRGASLITQLLALSKIRPPETKPLSVSEHVREASELFLRVLGSGITFELLLDDTNAMVTCDPTQLESAVLNMLINARDAMNGVGRIWIRTRVQHVAYDADLPDGEYVVLEVGDNGPGMSAEIRARVFEPFFSTKAEKGTGLGLAQVLGFAMHANGAARIESEPGDGTLIQLYLKTCSDLATPQATPAAKTVTPQSTAKTKILLIEDNPEVRNALAALLDVSGFLVHPVASGFTAVQSIEHYIPDVVITDCGLPAFNGPAIARVLHELIPKIPVIFLTGASDMDAVRAALPLNAVLLQKPTSIDVLCDAIDLLVPTPRK